MLRAEAKSTRRGPAAGFISRGDLINDILSLVVAEGGVVIPNIREVIFAAVVGFAY
jgi:hypothetical protein